MEESSFGVGLQAEVEEWRKKATHLEVLVEEQRTEVSRLELALEEQREATSRLQVELEEQRALIEQVQAGAEEWQERALRLQAEMDNYRKRQQRLAAEQMETERRRLLGEFLRLVDDLERTLAASVEDSETLRQGVALTHRAALQLLQREGVEPVQAEHQPFDPNWHEAVATVRTKEVFGENGRQPDPDTVIQVLEPGYRQGDRLLRPARVVVAVEK